MKPDILAEDAPGLSSDGPRWTRAWATPLRGSLIDAGDIVLLRQTPTIAVDARSGVERWRVRGFVRAVDGDPGAYYSIHDERLEFTIQPLAVADGTAKRTLTVPHQIGEDAILLSDAVLIVEEAGKTKHPRFVSLVDGSTTRVSDHKVSYRRWSGAWDGLAVFHDPYTAISIATGATKWELPGCCLAASLGPSRYLLQQEGHAVVVDGAGTLLRTVPGKVVATSTGGAVLEDHGVFRVYFLAADSESPLTLPGGVIPGSIAIDAGYVYYTDRAGVVRELDVAAQSTADVRPKKGAGPPPEVVRVPPVVSGDRIYVHDDAWDAPDAWEALDRHPLRMLRMPTRSDVP